MTDIVEQAARVACPNGPDHDHQPNLDQGCNWALQLCQTLADAGLLRDPVEPTKALEELITEIKAQTLEEAADAFDALQAQMNEHPSRRDAGK